MVSRIDGWIGEWLRVTSGSEMKVQAREFVVVVGGVGIGWSCENGYVLLGLGWRWRVSLEQIFHFKLGFFHNTVCRLRPYWLVKFVLVGVL